MIVLGVLLYDPELDVARSTPATVTENDDEAQAEPSVTTIAPFEDLVLERAKAKAEVLLIDFGMLQDRVEREQLGMADYEDDYEAVLDRANEGDAYFNQREFDDALDAYEQALQDLQAYVARIDELFAIAFAEGETALNTRDEPAGREAFTTALRLKPYDIASIDYMLRVELLPEVNRLVREGERAAIRDDYELAERYLVEARTLDANTPGLSERIAEMQHRQSDEYFDALISDGYKKLRIEQFMEAKSIFKRVLAMRPNYQPAVNGIAEAEQGHVRAQIANLQREAQEFENRALLEDAKSSFEQALELDNDLQFAREGLLRVSQLLISLRKMQRILDDPAMLSSNEEFAAAHDAVEQARSSVGWHAEHDQKLRKLEEILLTAAQPLQLVLLSDNTLDVRLATVGDLGPFMRKELSLRPGRYLLHGSGFGCRDVRKTIVVEADMSPISIRCVDPI